MPKAKQITQDTFSTEDGTLDTFGSRIVGDGDNGVAEGAEVQQLEAMSDTQLVDAAQGEKLVVRFYEFSYDLKQMGLGVVPSKQHIFNTHAKMVRDFLWKDGLEPAYEIEPRVLISKRQKKFRIVIAARARFQHMWQDRATTLQDIMTKK